MKKILFGFFIIALISCNEKKQKDFSLKGNTEGIENGTLIFLEENEKILDSTIIQNNSFQFDTNLPSTPVLLMIYNQDFSEYREFWAENKPMKFDATNSNFKNAKISGSETEDLNFSFYQRIDSLPRNQRRENEIKFVEENPSSIISASMLSLYASNWGKERTERLFNQFSAENKSSKYGKDIEKYLELNKEPEIGDNYIDFELENIDGDMKKLSTIEGKVILLEFWASWCIPCRKENPNLVKIHKRFKPEGFQIFAVSLDLEKKKWIKAIETDSLNWIHVSDLKGDRNKAALVYGVDGIPDNFLINENGKIIGRNLRGDKLNKKLKEVFQ